MLRRFVNQLSGFILDFFVSRPAPWTLKRVMMDIRSGGEHGATLGCGILTYLINSYNSQILPESRISLAIIYVSRGWYWKRIHVAESKWVGL